LCIDDEAMINFPIIDRLEVTNFALYPGDAGKGGLKVDFKPGLTLVIGANGLGKTTLINIVYRMLTGPFDISGLQGRTDLGNIDLKPSGLSTFGRSTFASRVKDGAKDATARLSLTLGKHDVVIERRLSDLKLVLFQVGKKSHDTNEIEDFQGEISRLVGVWSFGDWILLLRHIVFYFEDRRALVWDPSAQRQLLRFLFLPAKVAQKWSETERIILEMDSRARNLNAAVSREERALAVSEVKVEASADIREELKALEALQDVDNSLREKFNKALVELDSTRQASRLRHLKIEQEREGRYRELERAKLTAIEARFPDKADTARYILAQLLTEADCLACGHHVPAVQEEFDRRIKREHCVVCGSDLSKPGLPHVPSKMADRRVNKAIEELNAIEPERENAAAILRTAESEFNATVSEIAELDSKIAQRSLRVDFLVGQLPPAESEIHRQRSELAGMRGRVETLRADLEILRTEFGIFVESESRQLIAHSSKIKKVFEAYSEGFLLEQCSLIWSPQRARVGQTGMLIEFPAFELEMTGASFTSPVLRSGPEQVSESQREFIDLAFRMALMEVAGADGAGSLIIDAPETSLDAVFAARAAKVLARFAEPKRGNRLFITSNLVEGNLIPELLSLSSTQGRSLSRLVDLFKIAEPTAATRQLRVEYRKIMDKLVKQLSSSRRRKLPRPVARSRRKRQA
jgi:AAA domain